MLIIPKYYQFRVDYNGWAAVTMHAHGDLLSFQT